MTPPLQQACSRAVQVITPDGLRLSGGRAVLFALGEVGIAPALMRLAGRRPVIWLVDAVYAIVARNRTRVSRLIFLGQAKDGPTC
jgi:predicted DCC family thiol-disulfide oxidoreductase YuxK